MNIMAISRLVWQFARTVGSSSNLTGIIGCGVLVSQNKITMSRTTANRIVVSVTLGVSARTQFRQKGMNVLGLDGRLFNVASSH
jgi:hypothetical protein